MHSPALPPLRDPTAEARRLWYRVLATAACGLSLSGSLPWSFRDANAAAAQVALPQITRFSQFFELPLEKTSQTRPVRLEGLVLCSDPGWGQLYIYDGTQTGYLSPSRLPGPLTEGQRVEIVGTAAVHQSESILTNAAVRVLGPGVLPKAQPMRLAELGLQHGQWIEIEGSVRVAETSRDRLGLLLHQDNQTCLVYVLGPLAPDAAKQFRPGSKVMIRGINASKAVNGRLETAMVFAPGLREVRLLESPTEDVRNLPVVSVDALLNRELGPWTNRAVRINGIITAYTPGESLAVKDPTGMLLAHVVQVNRASLGQRVNVWGYLTVSDTGVVLKDAYFEDLSATEARSVTRAEASQSAPASAPPDNAEVLTQVLDVMKLPKEKLTLHLPVRLRGVITCADPGWHSAFFQDHSRGIYIDTDQQSLRVGQWVEVVAQVDPGGFAPQLSHAAIEVLGMTNLPAPSKVTLEELTTGHLDAQWVEIEGLVQRVSKDAGRVTLTLMSRKGPFSAIVTDFNENPAPTQLVDTFVSIQGACGVELNARGQLSGIILHTPGMDHVTTIEPIPQNPFDIPATPIDMVATFDPDRLRVRRVKVIGMVTLITPDGGIFVQNGRAAIRVTPQDRNPLRVGDWTEVLGFPTMKDFSPALEEAVFRQTVAGVSPVVQKTTAEQILLNGTYDATLVAVRAELLQNVPASANPKLIVQDGPIIFTAQLPTGGTGGKLPFLRSGSVLRLSGICSIQAGDKREPASFRLLLRDPRDVVVVRAASPWTTRHTVILVTGMLVVLSGALAWVRILRKIVQQRTDKLHGEIHVRKQAEERMIASLREKEILLKEIHHRVKNNIQVISSLLSLQIERDRAVRTVLSDVRDRVKSMALVHEQLYTSANLAQVDLAEYARSLMDDLFRAHGALASKITLRLEAAPVNVGVDIAVPFGLILNELASNALKHAFTGRDSGEILIAIQTGSQGESYLRFADNGVGLPTGVDWNKPRSLGLRLVQMLTAQLNGTLEFNSAQGTEVRLTLASPRQTHLVAA